MNALLALGVAGLAYAFGTRAKTDWCTPQGWGLIAFAATAVIVATVGAVDVGLVRRSLHQRLDATALGQIALAGRALERLRATDQPDRRHLEAARSAAQTAVRTSHGLYGPAFAWLARVELRSLCRPTKPDHLLNAGKWLDRAIEIGPATAAMLAERAFVFESFATDLASEKGDEQAKATYERASAAWLHALDLYIQQEGQELDLSSPRSASANARYPWGNRPVHPTTLSVALGRLPAFDLRALVTLNHLAAVSANLDSRTALAVDGAISTWLEALTQDQGWQIAEDWAKAIEAKTDAQPVLDAIRQGRAPDGPIGRGRTAAAAAAIESERRLDDERQRTQERDDRQQEASRRMDYLVAQMDSGQASAEDYAEFDHEFAEWLDEQTSHAGGSSAPIEDGEGSEVRANLAEWWRRSVGRATEADLNDEPSDTG